MKNTVKLIWFLVCWGMTFAADLERIVIVVNDTAVTEYDIDQFRQATMFFVPEKEKDQASQLIERDIHRLMTDRVLLLEQVKRLNIQPDSKTLEDYQNINLKAVGVASSQLDEAAAKANIKPATLKNYMTENLSISILRSKVASSKAQLTPQKVKEYVEKKQAENSVYTFTDYVVLHSDKQSKSLAHQLQQSLAKNDIVPKKLKSVVESTAYTKTKQHAIPDLFLSHFKDVTAPGATAVFRADNGYHVIYLNEVVQPETITDNQAMQEMFQANAERLFGEWFDSVKGNAYIHIFE